ncbi:hypothetical protein ACFLWO_01555 [Chloroflexota bacterium]
MENYSVVGKRLPDIEGPQKVTGQAQYTGDIVLPNTLIGKILHSPYAHARILNIDTSKAEMLPGVKCVITGKDTSGITYGDLPAGGVTMNIPWPLVRCVISVTPWRR